MKKTFLGNFGKIKMHWGNFGKTFFGKLSEINVLGSFGEKNSLWATLAKTFFAKLSEINVFGQLWRGESFGQFW